MWKNVPAWIVILRDVTAAIIGLGGAALLIVRGSPDPLVLIVLFTLAGAPGAASLTALLSGQAQANSQPRTGGESSSGQRSDS